MAGAMIYFSSQHRHHGVHIARETGGTGISNSDY